MKASQREELIQLEKKLAEGKELKVGLTQVKVMLEQTLKDVKAELKKK